MRSRWLYDNAWRVVEQQAVGGRVESGMTALEIATRPDFGCQPANITRPHLLAVGCGGLCSAAEKEAEEEGVANTHTITRPKGAGGAGGEVCAPPRRCAGATQFA